MNNQIACIGAGNMAEAIISGWLDSGFIKPEQVCASEINAERRKTIRTQLGIKTSQSNADTVKSASIVLLAVKPQVMEELLQEIKEDFSENALVISIAAGLTTEWLASHLPGHVRIIRVMPNTPALVKKGMSCLAAGPRCTEDDLRACEKLFQCVGDTLIVEADQMDAVTAVSGSGPAYVFYLMENMIKAAEDLGLSCEQSQKLVLKTVQGAAELAMQSPDTPSELRRKVTSKGGTTEAAINSFDEVNMGNAIQKGVKSAEHRSRELSG